MIIMPEMQTGIQIAIQLVNVALLAALAVGFVMLVKIMSKLNKALNIYLEQHKNTNR